jgi:hypothetical protein
MNAYNKLKKVWKKLGIRGSVKNYSDIDLWVLETDTTGIPIARILPPGDFQFDSGYKVVEIRKSFFID